MLATTDPMDLADALVQRWHAPAAVRLRRAGRAAAAAAAGGRLAHDRRGPAGRAGSTPGGRPLAALRLFVSQTFAVLVAAIRRGVRLATAMEARGFDSDRRTAHGGASAADAARDWWLVAGSVAAVLVATAVSVAVGSWRLPFS